MEKGTKKNALLLVAIGAGIIWYFSRQFRRFDIGAAGVSQVKIEGGGIRIRVKIPVLNRSDIASTIDGFLGALYYGSNQLGTVTLTRPTKIEARNAASPEFEVLLGYANIATELAPIVSKWLGISLPGFPPPPTNPSQPAVDLSKFRIIGTLYVGALSIDINQSVA